jgi:hypothetical protein
MWTATSYASGTTPPHGCVVASGSQADKLDCPDAAFSMLRTETGVELASAYRITGLRHALRHRLRALAPLGCSSRYSHMAALWPRASRPYIAPKECQVDACNLTLFSISQVTYITREAQPAPTCLSRSAVSFIICTDASCFLARISTRATPRTYLFARGIS